MEIRRVMGFGSLLIGCFLSSGEFHVSLNFTARARSGALTHDYNGSSRFTATVNTVYTVDELLIMNADQFNVRHMLISDTRMSDEYFRSLSCLCH